MCPSLRSARLVGSLVHRPPLLLWQHPNASQFRPISSTSSVSSAFTAFSTTPVKMSQQETTAVEEKRARHEAQEGAGGKRFRDFDLAGGVYIVTGAARGLGLHLAEALVEAGGEVHCLDRQPEPDEEFYNAQNRVAPEYGGSLHYGTHDVRDTKLLNEVIEKIASRHNRIDGLIAAAGIQHTQQAIYYKVEDATRIMEVNYTGVFMTATAVARQMLKYKNRGSICLIASMSGIVANKGMVSPAYNSSKAAVIQLARNLAMEWGRINEDGSGGIRVNSLSPGHVLTPMLVDLFKNDPQLKKTLEEENMLGRLSEPEEFKSAGLFLLSKASSFMTAQNLVIDGGHTSW